MKTLEERIRRKAREALKKELDNVFNPAISKASLGSTVKTRLIHQEGEYCISGSPHERFLSVIQCLKLAKTGLYECLVEAAEEKAINEFLRQVDSLQDQIDELREL